MMNNILDFFAMDGVIKVLVGLLTILVITMEICHEEGNEKIYGNGIQKACIVCTVICELLLATGCGVRSMKEEGCDPLPFILFLVSVIGSFVFFGFTFNAICRKERLEIEPDALDE